MAACGPVDDKLIGHVTRLIGADQENQLEILDFSLTLLTAGGGFCRYLFVLLDLLLGSASSVCLSICLSAYRSAFSEYRESTRLQLVHQVVSKLMVSRTLSSLALSWPRFLRLLSLR